MTDAAPSTKRRYDNTRRRARANETRERIVTAGADLVRETSIRDWRGVTMRTVATRAGVNERTVYRHFTNERALRDAIMQRLEEAVGIDLASLRLDDVADAATRIFRHVAAYPRAAPKALDSTLAEANRRQHAALLGAVEDATAWSHADRTLAAAMLDVLWAVGSYERLVTDWQLDDEEAIRAMTWVIRLVQAAIQRDEPPPIAR